MANFYIVDFQHFTKKMQKKCKNIWSVQKKAVPLHPLSLKNGARPKRAQAMIFERMSIHNKM